MKTVTFDTTTKPTDALVTEAVAAGWHIAYASVSIREAEDSDFLVTLVTHDIVPELGNWTESPWDESRWAEETSSRQQEAILQIISNNSFPKDRTLLTVGQQHQLRDAMILDAHAFAQRKIFVTGDAKAFIANDRRQLLQDLLKTTILTPVEFKSLLASRI